MTGNLQALATDSMVILIANVLNTNPIRNCAGTEHFDLGSGSAIRA